MSTGRFRAAAIGLPAGIGRAAMPAHADEEQLVEESRGRLSQRLDRRDRLVSAGMAASFLAIAVPLAVLARGEWDAPVAAVAALVVFYALSARVEFEVGTGTALPTQVAFVPMLFLVPPATAPLCVALALVLANVPDLLRRRAHVERSVVLALVSSWHAIGPAAVLVAAGVDDVALRHWPVYVAALAAQFALDFASAGVRDWLVFRVPPGSDARLMGLVYLVDVALTPIGLLAAAAAASESFLFLLAAPIVVLLAIFARERRVRIDHALELGHAYRGTALLLGDVVEADDAYTGQHSRDVVSLALAVADELGLSARERGKTELAALLHDIGKLRVPSEIINKRGPLTPEERRVIEGHTIEGEVLLARIGGLLAEVGTIVRSCHERWDGAGYPDGLSGEQIPMPARIVACCDAFNAMTTDRPYRAAMTIGAALDEIDACAGTQFDPTVAAALVRVVSRSVPPLARARALAPTG